MPNRTIRRTNLWNLFFHYFSIITSVIIGFVLTPLYIKYIKIETYGAWLASGEILVWITLVDPGLSTIILQKVGFHYGQDNKEEVGKYIGSGLFISIIICSMVFVLGIIGLFFLPQFLQLRDYNLVIEIKHAFFIAIIGTVLMFLSFAVSSSNQGLQSSLGIGVIFIGTMLSAICLNLFLLYKGYGISSIAFSIVWRGAFLLVGNSLYLFFRLQKEKIRITLDLKHVKQSISLLSFTFFSRIATVISGNIENTLIARNINITSVPIYSFSKKGPDISRMFLERPFSALTPTIALSLGKGKEDLLKHKLNKLFHYFIWSLPIVIGGGVVFNDVFVSTWVGERFYIGFDLNILIAIMILMQVVTSAFSQLLIAIGLIKQTSKIQIIHSFIHIILVYFGSKYFELKGLLVATLIAMLSLSLWVYPYLLFKKLKFDNFFLRPLLKELILVSISSCIAILLFLMLCNIQKNWLSILVHIIAFVLTNCLLIALLSSSFRRELIFLKLKFRKNKKDASASI